jgi:hypothetical protein
MMLSSLSSDEDDQEPLHRLPRRIRFIRDRENPFDLNRLNKATVMNLVHLIGHTLEPRTQKQISRCTLSNCNYTSVLCHRRLS